MQYSGLQILSFVVLLLGTGLALTSLATNNWSFIQYDLKEGEPSELLLEGGRRGLWEQCYRRKDFSQECKYRFGDLKDDLRMGELENVHGAYDLWEIICLALMTASASLGILTLVFAPCLCGRCGCCLSVFVIIAGLSAAAGVCAYTYFHLTGKSASLPKIDDIPGSIVVIPKAFGYSYWCAVVAAVGQLLASVLFSIGRGRSHEYEQTI